MVVHACYISVQTRVKVDKAIHKDPSSMLTHKTCKASLKAVGHIDFLDLKYIILQGNTTSASTEWIYLTLPN